MEALSPDDLIRRLPKYFTISVASKRNSGKSYLMGQIIKALLKAKRVDMVVVMSGSAGLNDDYDFLPEGLVMKFNETVLKNIWEKQLKTEKNKRKHIFIILDDCLATPEAIRNETVNVIYSLGRHGNCSMAICSQHTTTLLSPIIKGNSDLIMWSKLSRGNLEIMHDSTTNISKKDFILLSEKLGGINWQFVVLDNYIQTTDPSEFLTVVRAK
jgi:hypothetical protein